MNLKYKILLVIASLLLFASITSSVVNYRLDVEDAQDQLVNVSLPLSVDNIYTEIQQRMIEPLIVSSLMAHDTFVKDWLLNGEKNLKLIQKYLLEIQNRYSVFTTFLVSDATKNYYHSRGIIDVINPKNKDDNWYFTFKNSTKNYEVNLDHNQNLTDTLIMFINYKVRDYAQKYIAVTGVGIELLDIQKMLNFFKQKYNYDVYFVDDNGELTLFSKKLNKRGNIKEIKGLSENADKILSEKSYLIEYTDRNNDEYFLTTKYIKKLHLHLLVEINKKEYMQNINKKFYINLFISLLITILIVLIIVYAINIYQKQLEKLAGEDTLTGLANRRKFNENFAAILKEYHKKIKKVSLLLIDIDDFKLVNDTYGHIIGDNILKEVAIFLKENLRKEDKIARWGGEEFAILLVDVTCQDALNIARQINQDIQKEPRILELIEKPITFSMGVGELRASDSQDGLIQRVDAAMYEAKEQGKNRVIAAL
jgi:diguanylate cyclase (GGDEF)-like protein